MKLTNRKGARRKQDIPDEVLVLLNRGELETVNTMERLAVDHVALVGHTFPEMGFTQNAVNGLIEHIRAQKNPSTMNTVKLMGACLYQLYADKTDFEAVLNRLRTHPSDTIRSYAAMLIASHQKMSLEEKLDTALPLVADKHFGVREVIWIALRPDVARNLEASFNLLSTWTASDDENIRRFASEVSRPRGVWCKHIPELKEQPELGLPVLEPLKADPSRYVQLSVGNWLNDASKTRPDFVTSLCKDWKQKSNSRATELIINRATRSMHKA